MDDLLDNTVVLSKRDKAMKLCYRGVFYEYYPSQPIPIKGETVGQISRSQYLQPEAVPQSVRVLCYRGVFYIREMRSCHPRLISAGVVHSPNDSTQLNVSNWSYANQIQRMGFLYKLYCMGWINGSLQCLPPLQHWLLSILLYYQRGYTEGYELRQQHLKSQR